MLGHGHSGLLGCSGMCQALEKVVRDNEGKGALGARGQGCLTAWMLRYVIAMLDSLWDMGVLVVESSGLGVLGHLRARC